MTGAAGAMAEASPLIEEEFAQRDDMGLQPLTEKTEAEDQAFAKYVPWRHWGYATCSKTLNMIVCNMVV